MENRPAVSVIVPVYNVEPYVTQCVRSLFGQTLVDLEIIFIDDASTDESMDVIMQVLEKEFSNRKSQVKFFRMPVNSGQAKVRMQGLSMATGEYIIHCDSDDELASSDAYRLMYERAVAGDLDIVTCNYWKENASYSRSIVRQECNDVRDLLTDKVQGSLPCRLIRRSIMQEGIIAPVGDMGEDLVISLQAALRAKKIGHVDAPLYVYKYRPSSISKDAGKEAAIRRHYALIANVKLLVDLLTNSYNYDSHDPVIVIFKYYARHCIERYVGDKSCYALWKETFPEIDESLLWTPGLSLEKKFWFVMIHCHLYAYVKFITRGLRK